MDFGLKGKTAVVCGASAGIGRAVAEALAAEGCNLYLVARREEILAEVTGDLRRRFGVRASFGAADLSRNEDCSAVLKDVAEGLGGADILVTNAGGPPAGDAVASSTEDRLKLGWELVFLSAVRMVRGLLPAMRERKWGRIVAVTSVSLLEPIPGLALSNTYRPALWGFLKSLSSEVAADGVTINAVCPGYTLTGRQEELARVTAERGGTTPEAVTAAWAATIPAARLGRPEEIAAAAAFLCSAPASYITGTALAVDGGRTRFLLA